MGAFLQIIPERAAAACSGTMNLLNIGGRDPRSGALFNYIETYGGGQGALVDRDGTSAVQMHMTNTRNAPVEVIESTYPFFIRGYGLVSESAGAGEFRGGYGMRREFEIEAGSGHGHSQLGSIRAGSLGNLRWPQRFHRGLQGGAARRIRGAAPLKSDSGPDQGIPTDQHHSGRRRLGRPLPAASGKGPSGRGSATGVAGVGAEDLWSRAQGGSDPGSGGHRQGEGTSWMRGQARPSNSAGPAGPGETMKILVLNPFAGGMQELERCRQVAGPDTEIVFEDISEKCVEEDGAEAILMGCTLQSCPLTVTGVDRFTGSPHHRSRAGGRQVHRVHGGGQAGGITGIEPFRHLAAAAAGRGGESAAGSGARGERLAPMSHHRQATSVL